MQSAPRVAVRQNHRAVPHEAVPEPRDLFSAGLGHFREPFPSFFLWLGKVY